MPQSVANEVYSSAHFALQLDGAVVATLRSIDGGTVKSEVVNYHSGDHGDVWRQLAKVKYEDIKVVCGLATGGTFWQWMSTFIGGNGLRRSGSLVAADFDYKEKAKRNFVDAVISSIDFPKWDANDKNPANITVTISPEKITYEKGNGKKLDERNEDEANQQQIKACNFRFTYDGVGSDVCSRVNKVDAFSLKCKIIEYHYGGRMEPTKQAGKLEYPNLVFYLPEPDADEFRNLHMESVKGNRAPRKDAHLAFLNNKNQSKGEFVFKNCSIFNVSAEKHDASSEEVRLVKVEAAIEKLELKLNL